MKENNRLSRLVRQMIPLTLFVMLLCSLAFGQVTSGTIAGTVKDSSGAVIPGAKVTAKAVAIGVTRSTIASATGDFVLPNLPPAVYSLTVEATGFKKYDVTGLTLDAAARVSTGVLTLQVGAAATEVTVSADAGQIALQAESGERSDLITGKQLGDISMNGRNILDYMKLLPGVQSSFEGHQSSTGGMTSLNINGARSRQNEMTIDGASNVDTGDNGDTHVTVNADSIAEIRVLTSNYQAEFGKAAGGQIAVVTKNGTNQFHGGANFYHRHEGLNANDWYNNRDGVARPLYRYNDIGYDIGGPIFAPGFNKNKDKLFFYFSQEYFQQLVPAGSSTAYLPTTLERSGDFTKSVNQAGQPVTISGPGAVGNKIVPTTDAQTKMFTEMKALLSLMPAEGSKGWVNGFGTNGNNYDYRFGGSFSHPRREDIARVDYQINSANRLFARFVNNTDTENESLVDCGKASYPVADGGCSSSHPGMNFSLNLISTITPTLVNEFSVGPSYGKYDIKAAGALSRADQKLTDMALLYPVADTGHIPDLQWWDDLSNNWNWDYLGADPWKNSNLTINFNDNLTWVKKNHTLKAGIFFQHSRKLQEAWGNYNGEFQFGTDFAGDPFATILQGHFSQFIQSSSRPKGDFRYNQVEFYLQDTWKVNHRFTVDYGIRFAYIPPQFDAHGNAAIFSQDAYSAANAVTVKTDGSIDTSKGGNLYNGMLFASKGQMPKGAYDNPAILPEPRIGFAFDLLGDHKTILRGGYGMSHDRIQGNHTFNEVFNNPTIASSVNLQPSGGLYISDLASMSPSAGGTVLPMSSIVGADRHGSIPFVSSFSLGLQHQLDKNTTLDVTYVGSLGRHLVTARDLNELPYGTKFTAAAQDPSKYAGGVVPSVEPGLPAAYAAAGYKFSGQNAYQDTYLAPYKGYGQLEYIKFDGTSNYNSLQITGQRRFSKGLTFGLAYTWSKALTTSPDDESYVDPFKAKLNYRAADWDRTHVFAANYSYDLPSLNKALNGPKWLGYITDNFQLTGIVQFMTGTPITISQWQDGSVLTGGSAWSKMPALFVGLTKDHQLIAPQVGAAPQGTRDILRNGGMQNWDMSLVKNVKWTEQRYIQLRLESFNAFNHPNFAGRDTGVNYTDALHSGTGYPTLTPSSSKFLGYTSQYYGTGGPRVVQLGAKLFF